MDIGKKNLGAGLLFMGAFMLYGFVLIYLRDFAPDKEAWIAAYAIGEHFEARLAHVHGNLFALINVVIGFLLLKLSIPARPASVISWLALGGMLMPLGILSELWFGLPPILVVLGGVSLVAGVLMFGIVVIRAPTIGEHPSS